ncbi:uncharacterized protein LOC143263938 isoform X2 [Megachile rotundata]|uniref:uncharacterized protein LOC143263938 isoform X2 n=1 Tax=Megachile rotundata TaxID=143995 RepID=UPI003FD12EFA
MEIFNGKRKNTFIYVYEGYSYNADTKNPNIYRCCARQTHKCTATLLQRNEQFFIQKPHTHPNNPQCAEVLKLKSMILKECKENPCINNKDIFDNICRLNPDAAAYISYNSMKSIMSREKAKSRPPLPKTVQSAHEMLENYDVLKDIYQGCTISTENKYALIFSNSALLSALESAKEIYMDGTFSVVPQIPVFQQLYTVHIRYNDTGIATIFALCECRTLSMYKAIWTKIASLAPGLQHNLKTVMCDYEKASMEAIRIQFPAVTIHGCWFHFNQALLRKWRKLGLQCTEKKVLSMAMTMPLAPPDMFPQALNEIQLVADRSAATFPNVLQFMVYLRSVWLPIASKVSVYGSAVRTNNIVESFHNTLSQRFQTTRPNLWIFLDNLSKLIKDETINYERLIKNLKITRIRTRVNREKNAKIRLAQENLVSGILPLEQFLNMFDRDYEQQRYMDNFLPRENRLPRHIQPNEDPVQIESTSVNDIDNDDDVLTISLDSINTCTESEGICTYNSVEVLGTDLFIIHGSDESEPPLHLQNGDKKKTMGGGAPTSIDKTTSICTKDLQKLRISQDNTIEDTDVCASGSQINEHNLMEGEKSVQKNCCCKAGVSTIVLPCGHIYVLVNNNK